MIKIDLITGFLGSGKTTFLKKYARYCMDQGENLCILENDFGAVNVDMMLLQDLLGDKCDMEMVAGGCDKDCHIRRFKTKLIAMGMLGYDRVLVEPSGIFDVDEFFDVLREEPLDRWYEIDNVIAIVDAGLEEDLSKASEYMLASQIANAGAVIVSKTDNNQVKEDLIHHLKDSLVHLKCRTNLTEQILFKPWNQWEGEDYEKIRHCGYHNASYQKLSFDEKDFYQSVYFMNLAQDQQIVLKNIEIIFGDSLYGQVRRVKGFLKEEKNWYEINATRDKFTIQPIAKGQDVIIVIGEQLNHEELEKVWA